MILVRSSVRHDFRDLSLQKGDNRIPEPDVSTPRGNRLRLLLRELERARLVTIVREGEAGSLLAPAAQAAPGLVGGPEDLPEPPAPEGAAEPDVVAPPAAPAAGEDPALERFNASAVRRRTRRGGGAPDPREDRRG